MRLLLCLVALVVTGCMSEFDQTKTKAEQGELFPFATAVVIVASLVSLSVTLKHSGRRIMVYS